MLKSLICIAILLIIVACAGSSNQSEVSIDGEKIWKQNCVLCHGNNGKLGINGAKDLTVSETSLEDRIVQISEGKNLMTGFKTLLSPDEIEAVAKFTMNFK